MINERNNVEGERTEVEKHTGDVEERSEEKDALTAEETGEEEVRESLGDGSGRGFRSGFGAGVAETRGAEWGGWW